MVALSWLLIRGRGLLFLQLSSILLQHVAAQDRDVAPVTAFGSVHNMSTEGITIGGARPCKPLRPLGHLAF